MNKLFMKTLAVLNLGEGVIHIFTAAVSFWGMASLGVWDWRVATSPTADFALGFVSLITGVALGKWHSHGEPAPQRTPSPRGFASALPAA
jgi:hypothetical protein